MFGKKKEENEPVLLTTVNSNYQLGLVSSILEDKGIACLLQDRATGGYMRIYAGGSIFGTDVYVAPEKLERAKQLIEVLDLSRSENITEEELAEEALEAGEQQE